MDISILIWFKWLSRTSDGFLIIFSKVWNLTIYLFGHYLSLDRPIWTPTGIVMNQNKAKVHANFWIKRTFRDRVIRLFVYLVKKGVVKNSNPGRRWHQPPIPSHSPPWGLHLWIFISPTLDSRLFLGTPLYYINLFTNRPKSPWRKHFRKKIPGIKFVQNFFAVILVTKWSLYDLPVRSLYLWVPWF